jgi:hypothetical protein
VPFKKYTPPKPVRVRATKQCPECLVPFTPNHDKRIYCGVRCARKHAQRVIAKPPQPRAFGEFWQEVEEKKEEEAA